MRRHLNNYLRSKSELAQFLRFATVGVKISIIDAGGVYLLPWLLDLHLYSARIISLSTAMLVGYLLNRYFTFGGFQKGSFFRQMAGHFGVHMTGGALNYGVFILILHLGEQSIEKPLNVTPLPLFALFAGGVIGMTFNFILSKKLVFRVSKRRGVNWHWSFLGLMTDSFARYLFWIIRSFTPGGYRITGLSLKRTLLLVVGMPLFLLLQASHWLGLFVDELIFRSYKSIRIGKPVFITGIPRSGTTFLHRLLSEDSDRFTTMRTWEVILAPSITQKLFYRLLGKADRLTGRPFKRLLEWGSRKAFGDMDEVHSIDLWSAEEDYLALLPACGCFITILMFPFSPYLWRLGQLDTTMKLRARRELLGFYRSLLQRHLFVYRTKDQQLLIKNAAFGSWVNPLKRLCPGAQMVICVRQPDQALASQIASIQPGLAAFGTLKAANQVSEGLQLQFTHTMQRLSRLIKRTPDWVYAVDHGMLKANPGSVLPGLGKWLGPSENSRLSDIIEKGVAETKGHVSKHKYSTGQLSTENNGIEACLWDAYQTILQTIKKADGVNLESSVVLSEKAET